MSKALILVDMENEWTDKNSDYFVGDISKLIDKINKLIDFCRGQGYKIIFIRHVEKDSDSAFKDNAPNTEIISSLNKQPSDTLITKYKISPFYQTSLETELEGIEDIVVAGILTNLCVRSTVQDAYDRDFNITVIEDCCTAMDKKTHDFTLKDLKETREEIEILKLSEFMKKA